MFHAKHRDAASHHRAALHTAQMKFLARPLFPRFIRFYLCDSNATEENIEVKIFHRFDEHFDSGASAIFPKVVGVEKTLVRATWCRSTAGRLSIPKRISHGDKHRCECLRIDTVNGSRAKVDPERSFLLLEVPFSGTLRHYAAYSLS